MRDVIVIGASAGGIQAVIRLLARLPESLPAFIGVVIHRGNRTQTDWSSILGKDTKLQIVEGVHTDVLKRGVVYLAPPDRHMRFEHDRIALGGDAKQHFTRPAIDPLFTSAAIAYGPRTVGVVLTGGGDDGMRGLLAITRSGGLSLVQDPSEAQHASMPENAVAHDHVVAALDIERMGVTLRLLAEGREVRVE